MTKRESLLNRLRQEAIGLIGDVLFFADYYRYSIWRDIRMLLFHRDLLREHREVMRKAQEHD